MCEKSFFWNSATCSCENGKYVGSIIGDSVVICNEIIEKTKNYSNKKYFKNFLHFTSFFINYHSITDSYKYLPYKKSIKTKTFVTISRHQQIKRS